MTPSARSSSKPRPPGRSSLCSPGWKRKLVAGLAGLEPATLSLGNSCSIHLSHSPGRKNPTALCLDCQRRGHPGSPEATQNGPVPSEKAKHLLKAPAHSHRKCFLSGSRQHLADQEPKGWATPRRAIPDSQQPGEPVRVSLPDPVQYQPSVGSPLSQPVRPARPSGSRGSSDKKLSRRPSL